MGAGKGGVASRVKAMAAGAAVWAIDPNRRRVAQMHEAHKDLDAVTAVAENLPFQDGSFDVVYATLSLHHFSDASAAIGEAARMLRVGGRMVIVEVDPHSRRGRLFRLLGGFRGEHMTLVSSERLAAMVAAIGQFSASRTYSTPKFHLLQATRA